MGIKFFNEELKLEQIQEEIKKISEQLTARAYSPKDNPVVERKVGKRKLNKVTLLTENIIKNLILHLDKEIIVEFYDKNYKNCDSYKKLAKYLDHIGIITFYKAPSHKDFLKLALEDRSIHLIQTYAGSKKRKSSITATEKGMEKLYDLYENVAEVVVKNSDFFQDPTDFDSCIILQRRNKKEGTETKYIITTEQKEYLAKRFNDLLRYRAQIPTYNATFFDSKHNIESQLNDLPHMVYSYREGHNFDKSGRFYYFANGMESADRSSIKFDNKDTIELDFKCSLPSILLGSVGKRAKDFYDFKGFDQKYRTMFKKITVCILGAKQEKSVKSAMVAKLNKEWWKKEQGKEYKQFWIDGQTKDEVLKDIKRCCEKAIAAYKSFPEVKAKLFRGENQISLDLQYTESLIGWDIMNHFVALQKPILCIHDSFIVLEDDKDLLHNKMIKYYHKHVGIDPLPIHL